MADANDPSFSSSPPRKYRIAALRDYLPLSDEASMSTRGQHLPGIIQSRSSSSLANMRNRPYHTRRRSSFEADDLQRKQTNDSEADRALGKQGQVLSSMSNWSGGEDSESWSRRLSIPASLVTPQMRSQRLIGMCLRARRSVADWILTAEKATATPDIDGSNTGSRMPSSRKCRSQLGSTTRGTTTSSSITCMSAI